MGGTNMIQNVIAMIYDFDLTLSPHYMQKPLFKRFEGITEGAFWKKKDQLVERHRKQGKHIQSDTAYLHQMVQMAQSGSPLEGLTEKLLQELGQEIEYYPGIPEFFSNVKKGIEEDEKYSHYGIKIEHYVVSTGLMDMLRGSSIAECLTYMDGCEFFYDEKGKPTGVAKAVSPSQKVETIFKINKGIGIDVNAKIARELRRIPFTNMIYYGDGPSDVPVMSLIKKRGGFTFAVYNPNPAKAEYKNNPAHNAYPLLRTERAHFCLQADYREGTDLYVSTLNVLREISDNIIRPHEEAIKKGVVDPPKHR